jgi:hypothetical protein
MKEKGFRAQLMNRFEERIGKILTLMINFAATNLTDVGRIIPKTEEGTKMLGSN